MKTLKFLALLVFTTVTFYSCSDSNPIENETTTQKSIALRTALNELKSVNNLNGKISATNTFCFEFVFPLTFSFNNGTTVTVSSFEGLLDILLNETPAVYLEGIAFPFQVTANGTITTINNEAEFTTLIESCGFDTFFDDLENTFCFDIVFPIEVQIDGQVTPVNTLEELLLIGDAPGFTGEIQIVFPISVIYNNETVVINNIYEFYEMTNNCDQGGCVCTQEYAPVCVQTPTGIVEFGNMCYAICAGYSQNDLVNCDSTSNCSITNLTVSTGTCNTNVTGMFPLTINFSYTNAPSANFEVRNESNDLIGTYPLSSLPLTIEFYSSLSNGSIVRVSLGSNCAESIQFNVPDCNNCGCPQVFNPVCVETPNGGIAQFNSECIAICSGYSASSFVNCNQSSSGFASFLGTCFNIVYPVVVQSGGALVTVTSNEQLLQYTSPSGGIPVMNYPVTVTFISTSATYIFQNQIAFQFQMAETCN